MVKKAEKPSMKVKEDSDIPCYHCGKRVISVNQLVYRPVQIVGKKGKKTYPHRAFHIKCLEVFNKLSNDDDFKSKEHSDWCKAHDYFRDEYMRATKLSEHALRRLLGLRVGLFYPNNNNTRILKRGYPFSTIHKAMIVAKGKAMDFASKTDLQDEDHLVNLYLKFIVKEVEDVQFRLDKLEKDNKAIDEAVEKKRKENIVYVDYKKEFEESLKNKPVKKVEVEEEGETLADIFGWNNEEELYD